MHHHMRPVNTRGHVTATHPWNTYPQHFHVCANIVILSLLHVPYTRPCYASLLRVPVTCLRYTSLSHVASVCTTHVFVDATCRCNMTPRVWPPLQFEAEFLFKCYLQYLRSVEVNNLNKSPILAVPFIFFICTTVVNIWKSHGRMYFIPILRKSTACCCYLNSRTRSYSEVKSFCNDVFLL